MADARKLVVSTESWAFQTPFTITGDTFFRAELVHVLIEEAGVHGSGEASGVYYLKETGASVVKQINRFASNWSEVRTVLNCGDYCPPVVPAMRSIVRFGTSKQNSNAKRFSNSPVLSPASRKRC